MRILRLSLLIVLLILTGPAACTPAENSIPGIDAPVMPEALEETRTETGLEYRVHASLSDVEAFYVRELTASGWRYEGLGEGIGGLFLHFSRDGEILEISAYQPANEAFTRVVVALQTLPVEPQDEG